jgi:hypothetical protein
MFVSSEKVKYKVRGKDKKSVEAIHDHCTSVHPSCLVSGYPWGEKYSHIRAHQVCVCVCATLVARSQVPPEALKVCVRSGVTLLHEFVMPAIP